MSSINNDKVIKHNNIIYARNINVIGGVSKPTSMS